jgi:hypothetical protein
MSEKQKINDDINLVFLISPVRILLGAVMFGFIVALTIYLIDSFAFNGLCKTSDSFCKFRVFVLPGFISFLLFGLSVIYLRPTAIQFGAVGGLMGVLSFGVALLIGALLHADSSAALILSLILCGVIVVYFGFVVAPVGALTAFVISKLLKLNRKIN